VTLHNVRCESDIDMTILECCIGRVSRPGRCIQRGPVGVRCSGDDQFITNISATLMIDEAPTTGSTLDSTHYHNILVVWQIQQNRLRTTAVQLRSFEVRCFNEMHSIKVSLSNTTFSTQIGGLLRSSYNYTCCVSAVYESYTAQGVCTQAETIEPQLLTTVTEIFSTEAETPDLNCYHKRNC
jgi:hypothetical protein